MKLLQFSYINYAKNKVMGFLKKRQGGNDNQEKR